MIDNYISIHYVCVKVADYYGHMVNMFKLFRLNIQKESKTIVFYFLI